MTQQNTPDNFTGQWRCTHWYPNKDDSGQDVSEHIMDAHRQGDTLVLQSMPDDSESYLLVRLTIDGQVASGSWHETTRSSGNFKGAQYSGAGELIIGDDGNTMEGLWAGAGFDHKLNKLRVYTDKWQLERLPDTATAA